MMMIKRVGSLLALTSWASSLVAALVVDEKLMDVWLASQISNLTQNFLEKNFFMCIKLLEYRM